LTYFQNKAKDYQWAAPSFSTKKSYKDWGAKGKKTYIIGPISSFRSATEKLAEAIFEPKKILHTRRSKCVRRARRDSAEAFFRDKNRWEPIFLLQI